MADADGGCGWENADGRKNADTKKSKKKKKEKCGWQKNNNNNKINKQTIKERNLSFKSLSHG